LSWDVDQYAINYLSLATEDDGSCCVNCTYHFYSTVQITNSSQSEYFNIKREELESLYSEPTLFCGSELGSARNGDKNVKSPGYGLWLVWQCPYYTDPPY